MHLADPSFPPRMSASEPCEYEDEGWHGCRSIPLVHVPKSKPVSVLYSSEAITDLPTGSRDIRAKDLMPFLNFLGPGNSRTRLPGKSTPLISAASEQSAEDQHQGEHRWRAAPAYPPAVCTQCCWNGGDFFSLSPRHPAIRLLFPVDRRDNQIVARGSSHVQTKAKLGSPSVRVI